jgi:hypothetical protein
MSSYRPDDGTLAHHAALDGGLCPVDTPERRMRTAAGILLALSFAYALAATMTLPHRLALVDAIGVFLAGAIPGLLVTLLLWMARPGVFGSALRRRVIGASLTGAMGVAALSLIAPHF